MTDRETRLNAYLQWQRREPHDEAALEDYFSQKRRSLDEKTVSYEVVGKEEDGTEIFMPVDAGGNPVLGEDGEPEMLFACGEVGGTGIWGVFSEGTRLRVEQERESLSVVLPVFITLFCDPDRSE